MRILIFIFLVYSIPTFSQDTLRAFKLVHGKRSDRFRAHDFLSIQTDSVMEEYTRTSEWFGEFLFIKNNSIFIKPSFQNDDILLKDYKAYSEKTDSITEIKNGHIHRITYDRTIGTVAACGFWVSAATALVISPAVSFKKGGGFDKHRFFTISGIGLSSLLISSGIIILFGEKTMEIKRSKYNDKKIWALQY